ncbi:MAG: efflux RND transporter permease subunit, partial [Flavobacteriaceae bacterium]|nr:efflux RND transporter permease subunit [Flavobacteriaceae bacterium]
MKNNSEKDFKLSSWAINNSTTMYVVMGLILVLGVIAYFNMPREDYPEIKENIVFVSSIYPGNTSEDVEKLITEPLEDKLKSLNNINKIESSSQENFSIIIIEFDDDISFLESKLKVKDEIENALASEDWPKFNNVKVDPNVFNLTFTEEMPILNINISGDYTTDKLKEYSEILQKEIESLSEIKKADIRGALDKEVEIAVDIYKMMAAKVSFYDIIGSIQNGNISLSAGTLKESGQRKTIRIIGEINNPTDLENFVVKSEFNNPILLKDIASIKFKEKERTTYARENGKSVVTLSVKKRSGQNMIEAAAKTRKIVDSFKEDIFPKNLEINITNDQSELTENQVIDLVNSIIFGIVLVVTVLLFFLGFKNALFVGFAIPMSMFMSLWILSTLGFTLNTMILFGLIMGLGMLVDNGIVVVENVYRLMEKEGLNRIQATKKGISEIAFPIIISTATTIAAFIPLGLWPGRIGKFMVFFPITLSVVLGSSLLVAIFFNSVLVSRMMKIEDTNMPLQRIIKITSFLVVSGLIFLCYGWINWESGEIFRFLGTLQLFVSINFWIYRLFLRRMANNFQLQILPALDIAYEKILNKILIGKRPYLVILGTTTLLILSFIGFGNSISSQRTSIEFFPEEDPRQIMVYIEYPEGTDISKTNDIAVNIEKDIYSIVESDLYNDKSGYNFMVESTVTQVGEGSENPETELGIASEMSNRAKITL